MVTRQNNFVRRDKLSVLVERTKKIKLMLTRRAKTCSQTVSLSPAISLQFILGVYATTENRNKINLKNPYFRSSGFFKVIDVDTTEKLVASICRDRQHAHAYLQPVSRKTAQQR